MWLVDIFRAKVVDISEDSLTIEVLKLLLPKLIICFMSALYWLYSSDASFAAGYEHHLLEDKKINFRGSM